jgi:hypothetical protein
MPFKAEYKSRRMTWAGHVARMGRRGMHIGYWWEIQKERDHWEDEDVRGWTILKWILEKYDGMEWIGLIWRRIGDQWRSLVNTALNFRVP